MDFAGSRLEIRYGVPAADQILYNRHFVIGYSYYFRQAKWALEIVDPDVIDDDKTDAERADNFRSDYRVPEMFRADLEVYKGSGYDRGHLVPSADQRDKLFCFQICLRKDQILIERFGRSSKTRLGNLMRQKKYMKPM